jgi:hypothetical protein
MLYSIKNLLNKIKIPFTLFLLLLPLCIYSQHWQALDKGLPRYVRVMFADSSTLFVGTQTGGSYSNNIWIWDGVKWDTLPNPCPPISGSFPISFAKYRGEIYMSTIVNCNGVFKWNGQNWECIANNAPVLQLYVHDSILYAAGWFDSIGGVAASKIAKYNGNYWSAIDTTKWLNGAINCVTVFNNELYIGGNMISKDGTMSRLARWDGTKWLPLGEGVKGSIEQVSCFEVFNNELYVGGYFKPPSGPAYGIAKWNGNNWSDVGGGVWYPFIRCLKVFNNALYAGGDFTMAGGIPINYLAKWDGNNWCGFGISATETININVIEVFKGDLYIGGKITTLGSDTLNNIAKWIGGNYTDTCGNFTDIKELPDEPHINVFPNPVENLLNINVSSKFQHFLKADIYNMLGEKIYSDFIHSGINSIDIRSLNSGIYVLIVNDGVTQIYQQKIVKN